MTHFVVFCFVPKAEGTRIEEYVENVLSPYSEMTEGKHEAFYDWYSIGGRWNDNIATGNQMKAKDLLKKYEAKKKRLKSWYEARDAIAHSIEDSMFDWGFADIFRKFFKEEKGKDIFTERPELGPFYDKIKERFLKNIKEYQFYNKYSSDHVMGLDEIYHHSERMGWWGISEPQMKPDEWEKEFEGLLREAAKKNALVVFLDCHV